MNYSETQKTKMLRKEILQKTRILQLVDTAEAALEDDGDRQYILEELIANIRKVYGQ